MIYEVERRLHDNPTLPVSADTQGPLDTVLPYELGGSLCHTLPELAAAILKHWDLALKDWQQGNLLRWLETKLRGQNLLRFIQDINEEPEASPEIQLLRLTHTCNANTPLTWRGRAINLKSILTAASSAQEADQDWLFSLYHEKILEPLDSSEVRHLARLFRHIDQAWLPLTVYWKAVGEAANNWRQTMPHLNGYSSQNLADLRKRIKIPWQFSWRLQKRHFFSDLLLALSSTKYAEKIRRKILIGALEVIGYCPWFAQIGNPAQLTIPQLVAAKHLLAEARADAENIHQADKKFRQAQSSLFHEMRQDFHRQSMIVKHAADIFPRTADEVFALQHALEPLIEICRQIIKTDFLDSNQAAWAEKIAPLYPKLIKIQGHLHHFIKEKNPSIESTANIKSKTNLIPTLVRTTILTPPSAAYRYLFANSHLKAAKKIYKAASKQLGALSHPSE